MQKQFKNRLGQGKKRPLSISVLLGTLFFSVSAANQVLAAGDPSIVLQPGTDVAASQLVNKEESKIYNSEESVQIGSTIPGIGVAPQTIQPWKNANIGATALRNSNLDFGIRAFNWSLYLQGLGTSTPENEIFTNHFFGYCANKSKNESSGEGFSCQGDAALQYADVNVSSLVDGYRYEPDRERAARLFINNLVNPFPSAATSDPKLFTPEKLKDPNNRKIIAQALADQAVLSTSRNALASVLAKRRPIEGLDGRSFMEIMEKGASNFWNEAWQEQMKKDYQAAIKANKLELAMAIHHAIQEAYTNFILYQMYREAEQTKVLMAAMLAVLEQQGKQAQAVVANASRQGQVSVTGTAPSQ